MIGFTLSIDFDKKERNRPDTDSLPVDRAFIAASLEAVAVEVRAAKETEGPILDDRGFPVGNWKIGLHRPFSRG